MVQWTIEWPVSRGETIRNVVIIIIPVYIPGGGGGGDSKVKKVGVLIVLLRGVNFRFWSHLGC